MRTEFEFINNIRSKYSLTKIGDDCAILPFNNEADMLVTADMLVENVDFRLEWTTPEFLGHKILAVSLSDIAAMGGIPRHALLSIGIPAGLWKTDFLDRLYAGWHSLAEPFSVELVGGDVSKTEGPLVFDSTVIGEAPRGKAVTRAGAKPGDSVFVSGFLGGAAAGLLSLESGLRFDESLDVPHKHLLFRQLQPLPQTRTAILLQTQQLPSTMIDISDGLSSDLMHLIRASGVGCRLNGQSIPVDPAIWTLNLGDEKNLDLALNGGEDFELLFTVVPANFAAAQDLGFHHIGDITTKQGIIELDVDGAVSILQPKGFRHF